jgi:hypothetical protein
MDEEHHDATAPTEEVDESLYSRQVRCAVVVCHV